MAGGDQGGGGRAGAHHARVPEPFVDALAVDRQLAALFVALELLLEREQFRERRIRIRLGIPVLLRRVVLIAGSAPAALERLARRSSRRGGRRGAARRSSSRGWPRLSSRPARSGRLSCGGPRRRVAWRGSSRRGPRCGAAAPSAPASLGAALRRPRLRLRRPAAGAAAASRAAGAAVALAGARRDAGGAPRSGRDARLRSVRARPALRRRFGSGRRRRASAASLGISARRSRRRARRRSAPDAASVVGRTPRARRDASSAAASALGGGSAGDGSAGDPRVDVGRSCGALSAAHGARFSRPATSAAPSAAIGRSRCTRLRRHARGVRLAGAAPRPAPAASAGDRGGSRASAAPRQNPRPDEPTSEVIAPVTVKLEPSKAPGGFGAGEFGRQASAGRIRSASRSRISTRTARSPQTR